MSFTVRNKTATPAVDVALADLGITIAASSDRDLTPEKSEDIATSADLVTAIQAGDLVVLDPFDGVTELSAGDSEAVVVVHNDPHWRVGAGSRLGDISDVDLTGEADTVVLQFDIGSGNYVVASPSSLAGDMAINDLSDVDTTGVLTGDVLSFDGATWVDTDPAVLGGSGSFQLEWRFSTSIVSADPGSGRFRYDTATLASVTNIFVSDISNSGVDASTLLSALVSGNKIYIQENDDAASAVLFTVTGAPTDNTTWFDIPVSVDDSGTLHANNRKCAWVLVFGLGTSTQNLWETFNADSGTTTANTPTDTLTVTGGTGISTSITGDTLTITNDSPNVDQNLFETFTDGVNSAVADTTTDTFTFTAGAGITAVVTPGTDTLTITNTAPNVDQDLWETVSSDSGSTTANTTTDTLTVAGGTGISTAIVGDTLTITNDSPNVDQNLWETVTSDSGSAVANTTTDTLTIAGGTGISTAVAGDTLTITNDSPNVTQNLFETFTDGVNSAVADSATDTFTFTAGTGITAVVTPGTDTLTITNSAPNVDQSLWETITSDSGSTAANTTTDTLTIAGGTGISTAVAGDTLTITNDSPNVDQNLWATVTSDSGSTTADTTTDTLTVAGTGGIATSVSGDTLSIDGSGISGVTITTINGQPTPTFIDTSRANKVLSLGETCHNFANNQLSNDEWMDIGDASNALTGHEQPMQGTIVKASFHCEDDNTNTQTLVLYINDVLNTTLFTTTGAGENGQFDVTLNIDFSQSDKIQMRAGTGGVIEDTVVNIWTRWRG